MTVRGAVVVVTGGTRGLGLVLTRELGRRGAKVAACARDAREIDAAETDLRARGIDAFVAACDVTDRDQVRTFVAAVIARFGHVDVLINDAGTILVGPLVEMDADDFRSVMDVNFFGALNTMLAVIPHMRARKAGRIVNIGSVGGLVPVPHLAAYVASKFALVGFSQTARVELAKDGIAVSTINPGLMRTGSPENATFKGQNRAEYAWFAVSDSTPFLSMSAEEAAAAIADDLEAGKAWDVLTVPARVAALTYALLPAAVVAILSIVNLLLPREGGLGRGRARGHESESSATSSGLTRLSEEAAVANNERSARRGADDLPG